MKNIIKKFIFSLVLVLTLTTMGMSTNVSAAEAGALNDEILYVSNYEVTNGTITPGADFTLTVTVQNFSTNVTAQKALLVMENPDGVVPEYGTVSQAYLEDIGPGETQEVSFRYTSESSLDVAYLNFAANVVSENFSSSSQVRVSVGRTTDFSTEDVSIPETFAVDEKQYVSAMVDNLGNMGVTNVVMVARCDGEDIASSNIGTIAAGMSKTQSLSVEFEEEGQYSFDLVLTYTNSDGEDKEYVISSGIVTVNAEGSSSQTVNKSENTTGTTGSSASSTNSSQSESGLSNIVIICICGILLIGICCVILFLMYRRK